MADPRKRDYLRRVRRLHQARAACPIERRREEQDAINRRIRQILDMAFAPAA